MNVAFVDTETTGLDPERNPIWEIAVIIGDGPDAGEHVWQQQLPLNPPSTNGSDRMFIVDRAGSLPIIADGERAPRYSANINRWLLDNPRRLEPIPHKGGSGLRHASDERDYDALREFAFTARMTHADVLRSLVRLLACQPISDQVRKAPEAARAGVR